MRRQLWLWGVLDALAAALWSGPTAAFLAAFAIELGAGGAQLGLLLALNTLLANGLQLHGAQWTRRGRTSRRVALAAVLSRGSWLVAGAVPAGLALGGRPAAALLVFLLLLLVSAIATAAANPAMSARATVVAGEGNRTRYLADRMMATWLGALLGTAGMTVLLAVRPGVVGYALGFALAAVAGLLGLVAYAVLLRGAKRAHDGVAEASGGSGGASRTGHTAGTIRGRQAGQVGRAGPVAPAGPARSPRITGEDGAAVLPAAPVAAPALGDIAGMSAAAGAAGAAGIVPVRSRFGVRVAARLAPGAVPRRAPRPAGRHWWPVLARRLGAPEHVALGELVFAAAILQGGAAMIGPASPIWLVHYLGAPSSFLGIVSLASSLAAIASQRAWARWIDRMGADRVLGLAASAAALIPVGWLLVWHPWIAIPLSAYGGIAWGGYSLAMTSRLLQLAPPEDRAAYLGAYMAAVGVAGAVGSLIAGVVTAAVPAPWIPLVFALSFVVRGLGWLSLSRPAGR